MNKNKQFAVIGMGRFGQSVAKTLSKFGNDVLCIDNKMDIIQEISEYVTHAVQLDATDELAMRSIGIGNFDTVIIAIGSNMESSVMATIICESLGVKYILAKAKSQIQKMILEKIGADRVVFPEREMGAKIAINLLNENIIDSLKLSDEISLAEIEPINEWVGLSLSKSNIRVGWGLTVVAIKRGENLMASPRSDVIIKEDDILLVIGETLDIQNLSQSNKKNN